MALRKSLLKNSTLFEYLVVAMALVLSLELTATVFSIEDSFVSSGLTDFSIWDNSKMPGGTSAVSEGTEP